MPALENPPENACFGCGPSNPRGLHLNFERRTDPEGTEMVVSRFTPTADLTGWPGLLHIGLHGLLLCETSYWAAITLAGKVHEYRGPLTFDQRRGLRVGRTYEFRARQKGTEGSLLQIEAVSVDPKGNPCGQLTASFVPSSRARVERAGITLPDYLLREMDP